MAETSAESELRELGLRLIASCDKGDEEEVKRLLEHKEKDRFINERDKEGDSALFKAAKRGHFEIAQLLVHHGVDVNSTQNLRDVQLSYVATKYGHTKQMVIDLSSPQVGTKRVPEPVPSDPSYVKRVNSMSALMIASMNGDTKIARLLLEHGADVHINSTVFSRREEWSWTALMFACRNGQTQIVKLLLEYKAEFCVTARMGQSVSALVVASQNGHHETAELLLEQEADVDVESDVVESDFKLKSKTGTALMMASNNGDKKMIELLLKHGANVNLQSKHNGWTALMFASDRGHTESAKLLLEHGANVHAESTKFPRWTALMFACKEGQTQTVKLLLKYKAEVCVQIEVAVDKTETVSALRVASQNRQHETAEVLLEQGADVDVESETGTALMAASENDDNKMIELLLKHGAKVNLQDKDGRRTALMVASGRGHTECAKLLLEQGADVEIQGFEKSDEDRKVTLTALMVASRKGYTQLAKLLLEHKSAINMQNNEGTTALIFATASRKKEIINLLLNWGADLNIQNKEGMTALMFAITNKEHETVKLLLDHGPIMNTQNNEGMTALMVATATKEHETVELLLDHGANMNTRNNEGTTALIIATKNKQQETIKLLLDRGADVNIQNNEGTSALMIATANQKEETVKYLLEHGADPNAQNNEGKSALMISVGKFMYLTEIIEVLLKHGAKINMRAKNGWTALMFSSERGHTTSAATLLEQGADVDIQEHEGLTALMIACEHGHTKMAELLLEHKAVINMQNNKGRSALMIATDKEKEKPVKLLLDHGADANLQDIEGNSAVKIATEKNYRKLTNLFLEYEANAVASSTSITVPDTIHHVKPADLTAETSVLVTNSKQDFTWHEYGLNIHIPENSLPEGVQQCSIYIKASLVVEGLQLPQDTHLVSAVYSFKCSPKCQFSKRLTLEIQHCAKLENSKELCFIRSTSGSNFKAVESGGDVDSENDYYSHFPQDTSYGFVELDKFCKFGVGQNGVTNREYCANLYRYGIDQKHHKFHFNVVWDTKTHSKIIRDHYRNNYMKLEVCQRMEFEKGQIQLDIPFPSTEGIKSTSDDSWRILSLSPPLITKVEVDNFEKGKMIPSCQLLAECDKAVMPTDLKHSVQLKGAKDPYNAFLICVHVTRKRTLDDLGDNYGPGQKRPRTSTLDMSFTTVLRELSSKVSADWEDVGLFLGLGLGRLDIIKANNPSDCQKCFREMIKVWFRQQVDPPPSWSAIVEALDILGQNSLAQKLREKYQIPS